MKLVVALALFTSVATAIAECPVPNQAAVTATVQAMFDAAAMDDAGKLKTIFAPGFYTFDAGRRYDADTFQDAIRKMHQTGVQTTWHVTSPDVHISCGTAWIAYVNQGSFTQSGKATFLTWLESADLVYVNNLWQIAFLESARISETK